MSESKEGLQNSLDKLNNFCDDWQLTFNIKKTKTMVIQQHTGIIPPFIQLKDNIDASHLSLPEEIITLIDKIEVANNYLLNPSNWNK